MRIKITLQSHMPGIIDFNYQHQIQAIIYDFLSYSNPDYSSWLHNQGYIYRREQRFKLFVFSGIIFHNQVKIIKGDRANNHKGGFSFKASNHQPFSFSFQIASPVEKFIRHLVEGIFQKGNEIPLGKQKTYVLLVETLQDYRIQNLEYRRQNMCDSDMCVSQHGALTLKPLESPLFIKKPMPAGMHDTYLFPDDDDHEELLNRNLMHKYETLYGKPYHGTPLKFHFHNINGKTEKQITVFIKTKEGKFIPIDIKGTLRPFTVTGDAELIRIGLECGFGQNNSMGCGYVDTVQTVQSA